MLKFNVESRLKSQLVYYTTIKVYILQGKVSDMGNHTFDFRP